MLVLAGLMGMYGEEFTLELRERQKVEPIPIITFQVRADDIRAEYYPSGCPASTIPVLSFLDGDTALSTRPPVSITPFLTGAYIYTSPNTLPIRKDSVLTVKTSRNDPTCGRIPFLGTGVSYLAYSEG